MKRTCFALIALLGTTIASTTFAQGGPGQGGRFAIGNNNTPGWTLMTQEERTAHQQKMWAFKNYEECKAYQQEHHRTMDDRAKEQGKVLPVPRANACDRMQARGLFK